MQTKIVYQLDQNNYYLWETIAYENPVRPGTYLIPGGCVETPPPEIPENYKAKWENEWVLEVIPPTESLELPLPPEIINDTQTPLQKAEDWVSNSFSVYQLLQMKDWWDTIPHEDLSKLSATYNWIRTITKLAANNKTEFPEAPYSFEEILTETLPLSFN